MIYEMQTGDIHPVLKDRASSQVTPASGSCFIEEAYIAPVSTRFYPVCPTVHGLTEPSYSDSLDVAAASILSCLRQLFSLI